MDFAAHLSALLAGERSRPAVQYEGGWYSWGLLADIASRIDRILQDAGLGAGSTIALVIRERPQMVGGFYALLATRRATLTIVGRQPDAALAADIRALRPAAIIADDEDWTGRTGVVEAARENGSLGIALAHDDAAPVRIVAGLERVGPGPHHALPANCAVTLLTSGTTGPAKRIPVYFDELDKRLAAGRASSGVAINALPLHTMGGVFGVVDALVRQRPISILEKFDVRKWTALIREHKPKRAGAPPAVLRMILDADIPREDLASVKLWMGASAPLERKLADEVERRYGFQCLQGWGATEMLGSVTGWSEEDIAKWSRTKASSCGRPWKGVQLRIVDPETAAPLRVEDVGRVEVWRKDFPGDHWMTTNDLGRIDADGFLYITGRSDDVIIRGGLKIAPKDVEDSLADHPAVSEAVVFGEPDERVGQVPVAVVVFASGITKPSPEELLAWLRERLPAYKLPVRIVEVASIPRNAMMKVERRRLREQFAAPG